MKNLGADLELLYNILSRLQASEHQGLPLGELTSRLLPQRGVYFFCEPGEFRESKAGVQRIVRVGTHAVSAGAGSTLWGRLRSHKGTRAGGGNHRGSIFRLHVGGALLSRERRRIPTWGLGSTAPPEVRNCLRTTEAEAAWEQKVSAHLRSMPVFWIEVPDEPGPGSLRAYLEQNSIALLSNRLAPLDPPGPQWLGNYSPRREIRKSGLWNLNHVDQEYDPRFLEELEAAVEMTLKLPRQAFA